jgi:general stress protein 26
MSEMTTEAIRHIEKSSIALLTTVGEDSKPYMRYIGPFVNDGLTVSFFTICETRKVKHITANPFVTLFFQNLGLNVDEFRSVIITGKADRVHDGVEFNSIFEKLDQKSPGYKKYLSGSGVKPWAIYKVTAKTVQFTDLSKKEKSIIEEM